MLGTTNEDDRNFIGVETMSLFGYGVRFVLLGCCKCFRIGITSYSIYYVSIALAFCRGATAKLSIHDYAREQVRSYVLPENPPRISSLKSVFQRDKYEEYILYTTKRGAVSGVTLKSNFYVFLACSVWCQM